MEFLKLVRLDHVADHYPRTFSGGMKQRVALARTLAQSPRIVLDGRAFGALDAQVRWEMQELLIELVEAEPRTIVTVTHDISEALYLADRILFLPASLGASRPIFHWSSKQGKRFKRKEELYEMQGLSRNGADSCSL